MAEGEKDVSAESTAAIQIVRLNNDKTRKDNESDAVYHVYFELSGYPPTAWRGLFDENWQARKGPRRATIDGIFLVVHCPLEEVATIQLPALKEVVSATNAAYQLYARKEAAALEHREDVWTQERKDVDAMEAGLGFDKKP